MWLKQSMIILFAIHMTYIKVINKLYQLYLEKFGSLLLWAILKFCIWIYVMKFN